LLNYTRHFVWLILMAALLAITTPWRPAPGVGLGVAVYGALHASAIVISLSSRQSIWRQVTFIAMGALLCVLAARMGVYGLRYVGRLPNLVGPLLMLSAASAAGAAAYGVLIRSFLNLAFPLSSLALTSLACMFATLAAFIAGRDYAGFGGLWLALAWWFAFSGGLWYQDHRRKAASR
jgi:hypothetical protein